METTTIDLSPILSSSALTKSVAHFARPKGPDLLERTSSFFEWQSVRRSTRTWPYSRSLDAAPGPETSIRSDAGEAQEGINFASQDYLGLASHPSVHEAAVRAVSDLGPHSAGSPMLLGNTRESLILEKELAAALQTEHVVLFPTGWAAGFGSIVGLVRNHDYIVMDDLAHACLQQGAYAATSNVVRHKHLGTDEAREILRDIRAKDPGAGILVITEGLFSMDSDSPRIEDLQESCHEMGATLLVDVAHDFGALGSTGGGHLEIQGMLGKVDLVMGSFSKTFASNGGFLATHRPEVKQFVKMYGGPHVFSNALSPVQSTVVREALRIVKSDEGSALRGDMLHNARTLRDAFAAAGIQCLGDPSAIVPVPMGSEKVARLTSALSQQSGVLTNLVEFPAVPVGSARLRMQVMARHSEENCRTAARRIVECHTRALECLAAEDKT